MSNASGLPSVPIEYARRKELWIRSSVWLTVNDGPFVALSIQDLGYAERLLLNMEQRIKSIVHVCGPRSERENLIMECSAHSKLWILGLYEVVRLVRETDIYKFKMLEELFHKLEILRMPIAKHEVKSAPKFRKTPHCPTGIWDPASGRVGWQVFDPVDEGTKTFTRTSIANEFLSPYRYGTGLHADTNRGTYGPPRS